MKLRWAVPLVFLTLFLLRIAGVAQNYAPAINYPTAAGPVGVTQGDFNEDGNIDVIAANSNASSVTLFPGQGDGTFGPTSSIAVSAGPFSVASGDVDNDGHLDLVISLTNGKAFLVMLGNGNGTFQVPNTTPIPGLAATSTVGQILLKDVNRDGKLDVAIATDQGVAIFLNNGAGGFVQSAVLDPTTSIANIAVVDMNGDGIPDVIATENTVDANGNPTGSVISALGNGDGTFQPVVVVAGLSGPPTGLAIADLNHDNRLDIIVSNISSTTGTGGPFIPPNPCTGRICLPQDVPTGSGGGTIIQVPGSIYVIMQQPGFIFSTPSRVPSDPNPGFVIAADLDGDGNPDLAEAPTDLSSISLFRGNGDGTFAASTSISLPSPGAEIGTAKLTNTAALDLFASDRTVNQLSVFVNQGANTLTLTSSANPAAVSQPVTLTATVHPTFPTAGPLSGSIIFADGPNTFGTAAVDPSGVSTFSTSFGNVGSHSLQAVYGGNSSYAGGSSATLTEVVATAPNVSVTVSPNPGVAGQPIHFVVTVSSAGSSSTPTGRVTLFNNGSPLVADVLDAAGSALLVSALPAGTNSVVVQYSGDVNFPAGSSSPISVTVNRSATASSLTASPNPTSLGQAVTFTAVVSPSGGGSGVPTGSVTFNDGATQIGTAVLDASAQASLTLSSLSVGTHNISAAYAGDSNFAPSTANGTSGVNQVVNQSTATVSLTSSVNPSVHGQGVSFTVTVAGGASVPPSGTVTLTDNGTTFISGPLDASAKVVLTTSSLATGTHTLIAQYSGDSNYPGTNSQPLAQTVSKSPSASTLTSSPNPTVSGQIVTFSMVVTASGGGSGIPTGTAIFTDGTTQIGTAQLDATGKASVTVSSLSTGAHTISASYSGDANFNSSVANGANGVSQTVNKSQSTTALSSSPNPSTAGQAVTLIATVSASAGGSGIPTGTVVFTDGANQVGNAQLDATGKASVIVSTFSAGAHSISANYGGDANFNPSSATGANGVNQTVSQSSATVAVSSSLNPSVHGQAVTFSVAVSASGSALTPTGSITILSNGSALGSAQLDASAKAVLTTSALAVGSESIIARYAGDANFPAASSSPLTQTVNKSPTTSVLTTTPNPSLFGQPVTLTITVSAAGGGSGIPSGTVTLSDGASQLGSAQLDATGKASISVSSFAPGSHNLSGAYVGDANFASSSASAGAGGVSQVVNQSNTTVSLISSQNPSVYGQSVTITATVQSSTGIPTGTVTFNEGTVTLGTAALDATGKASLALTSLAVGNHSLSATYGGSGNFQSSTSSVLVEAVSKNGVVVTVSSAANPATYGQSVQLTATVQRAAPATSGTPTGTITFSDGNAILGQVPVNNTGTATLSSNSVSVGTHQISAAYGGDLNFNAGSASLGQTINKAATTVAVTASANPSTNASAVTFVANVTAVGSTPSGTVQFMDGNVVLGSATLDNSGSATLTVPSMTTGAHTIAADYTGTANYLASQSTTLSETIVDSHSQVVLVASANPQKASQPVVFTATVIPAVNSEQVTGTIIFRDGQQVLASLPVANGGASLTVTTLSVGAHTITALYQVSVSPGPFDGVSAPVTETIQANAVPDFSVRVQNTAAAITSGSTFATTVTLTPLNGFTGTVSFACAGLPANAQCTFQPAQQVLDGTTPMASQLQIRTSVVSASNFKPQQPYKLPGTLAFLIGPGIFGCVMLNNKKRVRIAILVISSALILGASLSGCGSSGHAQVSHAPQPHTYTVAVQAVSGTVVHSTNVQLTLQ